MRVLSTQAGFYCNVYIDAGHVFDLIQNADGTDPLREDWVPKLDAHGKDTGDGDYVLFKDPKTGQHVHRDYAPDSGDFMIRQGPKRGEVTRLGWMKIVSNDTPITIDVEEFQHGFDVNTRKPRKPPRIERVSQPAAPPQKRAG